MRPKKILYVDDEAMSLKYFERLISPLAPVITALSVHEGKIILEEQHAQIAVLVSDQRMPGANGNELLRYARDNYPSIVRMMTTAYSEIGEAIGAINDGEIYRYISKPWDLENLRADLKNALELANLRNERDSLLSEKMLIQQQELLASRISHLAVVCAGVVKQDDGQGLHDFLSMILVTGCASPRVDWHVLDYPQLMQSEAQRGVALGKLLLQWQQQYESSGVDKFSAQALAVLAKALPDTTQLQADALLVTDRSVLTWVLDAPAQQTPTPVCAAWLAWLLWCGQSVQLSAVTNGWELRLTGPRVPHPEFLSHNWLANSIEQISQAVRT
jgi:two-component system probable response regulator PhcQ